MGEDPFGSLQDAFPAVEFEGDVTLRMRDDLGMAREFDLSQWPLFRTLIGAAFEATQWDLRWPTTRERGQDDLAHPRFIFDLGGFPEAFTRPRAGGSVRVSLGMLLVLCAAPQLFRTSELLIRDIEGRGHLGIQQLTDRFLHPDPRLLDELLSILSILKHCHSGGWETLPWSREHAVTVHFIDGEPLWPGRTQLQMARLTALHETAHWHVEKLTADSGRARLESDTKFGLEAWLKSRGSGDPDRVLANPEFEKACAVGMGDPKKSAIWVRELVADQMAIGALTSRWRQADSASRMRWYGDIALYFLMVEMYELFRYAHALPDCGYPPARLRRSFSAFVLRMRTGQSEFAFQTSEWGIGFAVTAMTRCLKSALVDCIEKDPDRLEQGPLPFLTG